jgi:membrane-associated protein
VNISEFFSTLLNPESFIEYGGLLVLAFIIFAETGLFFGFFLPGDTLLFTAGLFCGTGKYFQETPAILMDSPILTIVLTLSLAGVLGNYVGYWFGRKTGPVLFKKDDTLLFKKRYVVMAKEFYEKYGGAALVFGRFMPVIRTFAPIFAGIVGVNFRKFTFFNILGSVLWVFSMTFAGYFLGKTFPQVKDYLEYIIIGIVIVSTIPVLKQFFQKQVRKSKAKKLN